VLTEIHYDNVGRVLDSVDGKGVVTRSIYDAFGNATDKIEALGLPEQRTTHSVYDALGRLTAQTTAFGTADAVTSGFRFDAFGNEIAYVDPRGPLYTTLQMFDGVNRQVGATDPLGNTTRTDYDAFGNIVRAIDPNGNAGYFYYDQRNLLVAQVDSRGRPPSTCHDSAGKETQTIRYATCSVPYDPVEAARARSVPRV
jgi:YD repeat-containing protein